MSRVGPAPKKDKTMSARIRVYAYPRVGVDGGFARTLIAERQGDRHTGGWWFVHDTIALILTGRKAHSFEVWDHCIHPAQDLNQGKSVPLSLGVARFWFVDLHRPEGQPLLVVCVAGGSEHDNEAPEALPAQVMVTEGATLASFLRRCIAAPWDDVLHPPKDSQPKALRIDPDGMHVFFSLRLVQRGGRSTGNVSVGMIETPGKTGRYQECVRKRIPVYDGIPGSLQYASDPAPPPAYQQPGKDPYRLRVSKQMLEHYQPTQAHHQENLSQLSRHSQPNVLRILKAVNSNLVDDKGQKMSALVTFTPWYAAGSLFGGGRGRLPREALPGILLDVWNGLHWMHDQGWLHYDIKPGNILVDVVGPGRFRGVVGDLDDMVFLSNCSSSSEATVISTPCYGAPFQHCDKRRDVVALLLTTLETLSGQPWWPHCESYLAGKLSDPSLRDKVGYLTDPNGNPAHWRGWQNGIYMHYAHQVQTQHGAELGPLCDLLRQLEHTPLPEYKAMMGVARKFLSGPTAPPHADAPPHQPAKKQKKS